MMKSLHKIEEMDVSHILSGATRQPNLFLPPKTFNDAVVTRNKLWRKHPRIPSWVDLKKVELDRYFTKPEIAAECHEDFMEIIKADGASPSLFIEPSAGAGSFYDLLPRRRRIGIDIIPERKEYVCDDFLSWYPENPSNCAVIGNPPFGYRAWLALAFVNHAATFANYIGMILPMAFQSDGKGSPKNRVEGAELVKTVFLPYDSFVDDSGKNVKINALWQVWRRGNNTLKSKPTCDNWIDLFTVDMRKERLCGQERMKDANLFLQRTFYSDPPRPVRTFDKVKYVCGYGIVIKRAVRKISKLLMEVDWRNYSNLAAHNCRHISMYHIRQALVDGGFSDE